MLSTFTRSLFVFSSRQSGVYRPFVRRADFATSNAENEEAPPNILITGGLGQIGTELASRLRFIYGSQRVWVSDIMKPPKTMRDEGPFVFADVLSPRKMEEIIVNQNIDWLVHLPSILSARGEMEPEAAWVVNVDGVRAAFRLALKHKLRLFIPSTIGVFGPTTPLDNTPDNTLLDPDTIYGISKRTMEMLGNYYAKRGLDFRSLRYPGVISAETPPGGGTTDYAVEIFYEAIKKRSYHCFLQPDTYLPMILMPDCLDATVRLLQAPRSSLSRSVYNVTGLSFTPAQVAEAIRQECDMPDFAITYTDADFRQSIADSWPNSLDDSNFRRDLQWEPKYSTVEKVAKAMHKRLLQKRNKSQQVNQLFTENLD